MTRIVAIVGATGNQGGSVARSLLQNPSFKVRGITRNASSEPSKVLASLGADIVQANGFHRGDMLTALKDAWGLYINVNSDDPVWKNPDHPTEFDLGKSIIDVAVEAGVNHLVFSSGPPCTEMTGGKVKMKAMDMKYNIEQYARQPGKFQTVTPINAAWYMENFLSKEVAPIFGGFPYFPDEDGYLTFRVPNWGGDNKVPFLSIGEDYGDIVHGIFLDPVRWNGHVVHGLSDIRGFEEVVADFEKVTGKKARFEPVMPTWEAFDIHGIQELEDVKLMFGFTQVTGGRYFAPEPTEGDTAAELKRATAIALSRPEGQRRLMTVREFFLSKFA